MTHVPRSLKMAVVMLLSTSLIVGCGGGSNGANPQNGQSKSQSQGGSQQGQSGTAGESSNSGPSKLSSTRTGGLSKVVRSEYDPSSRIATLYTQKVPQDTSGESIIDTSMDESISNYAAARFPGQTIAQVRVLDRQAATNYMVPMTTDSQSSNLMSADGNSTEGPVASAPGADQAGTMATSTIPMPPPGTTIDRTIRPLAGANASHQAKVNAVLRVASSKLGVRYVWGHSEDRGQVGFDCSNYTAYVYRHALGIKMSGASQAQYRNVGVRVPVSQMQPGDLVVFNRGGHIGIYAGNGRMIQEGGGLAKVGYLKLSPGSYWYRHITVVKRIFP